jgi:hypothetical protein
MRKLPTTLYSANREMKAILRNSAYGVTYSHLPEISERIRVLEPEDFNLLMQYTINAGGVVHFRKGGEDYLISLLHLSQPEFEASLGMEEIVVDPRTPKPPVLNPKPAKTDKVPTLHVNHKKPTGIDVGKYKDDVAKIPENFRLEAIEIMAVAEGRKFGATQSELCKFVPSFDYLEPEQQKFLLKALDEHSINFRYIDGYELPTRGTHAFVLVHRNFIPMEHIDYQAKELEVESPFAAQLSALKDKLVLAPEPAKSIPSRPASVASSEPTKPAPVETPVVEENVAQTDAPLAHEHSAEDIPSRDNHSGISNEELLAHFKNGPYAVVEGSTTPLGEIQKLLGECLARIAMNQAQIAVAQISINTANSAITNDVALMSKLNEELGKLVNKTIL